MRFEPSFQRAWNAVWASFTESLAHNLSLLYRELEYLLVKIHDMFNFSLKVIAQTYSARVMRVFYIKKENKYDTIGMTLGVRLAISEHNEELTDRVQPQMVGMSRIGVPDKE